jgi:hypothetical protein
MTTQTGNQRKNTTIIIGLFLLFFLPVFVSWFLVFFTDISPGSGGTQHGILINPPRQLDDIQLLDPLTGLSQNLHGKWTLFVMIKGTCREDCQDALYRMQQLRLASGKDVSRVQRAIYFSDMPDRNALIDLFRPYAGQLMITTGSNSETLLSKFAMDGVLITNALYLIDPAGFIMMLYPQNTEPTGIIKDMKRLLRISR